jgi:uncharacterized protein YndB with AHSA1/START domain
MAHKELQLKNPPVVDTGMLIRRPVDDVFQAIADPAVTTKFWFTKSSGPLEPGAEVKWTWEMYDVSTTVKVKEFEKNSRIVLSDGDSDAATTVEWSFTARDDGTTFVGIKESGFTGETGDDIATWAIVSMGGYTQVLAAMKALLEHDIVLTLVKDRFPDGTPH